METTKEHAMKSSTLTKKGRRMTFQGRGENRVEVTWQDVDRRPHISAYTRSEARALWESLTRREGWKRS
jgi:hypothetical protein